MDCVTLHFDARSNLNAMPSRGVTSKLFERFNATPSPLNGEKAGMRGEAVRWIPGSWTSKTRKS
jgi:hypothetical protein